MNQIEAAQKALDDLIKMPDEELFKLLDECDESVSYAFTGMLPKSAHQLITEYYGAREAKRSKVPLINHINEGLIILDYFGASQEAKDAYCLHPMMQGSKELAETFDLVMANIENPNVIAYAMEYRSVANEFLREKVTNTSVSSDIRLSPLEGVNLMLIADKVQNRKDFELYHFKTHPYSYELDKYFKLWLQRLDISEGQYCELLSVIERSKNE